MTAARPDTSGKTTTPLTHSCSNHCVIQVGPLGSDAMFEVVEISYAWFVHLLQYVLQQYKSGEFGVHNSGETNSGVSLSRNS